MMPRRRPRALPSTSPLRMPDAPGGGAQLARDTANRTSCNFAGVKSVWLFGYGSLIWKVDFPYLERRPATVCGWSRRFWQGSHDHRGTPDRPGRVVTLVPDTSAVCSGMAYRIAPVTFAQLDVREKNGYLRAVVNLAFNDGRSTQGVAYVAPPRNAAWLGEASIAAIARQIASSSGPSGSNREYAMKLAQALREMGADDPHVFAVADALRARLSAA